jgi:hypothetical protein
MGDAPEGPAPQGGFVPDPNHGGLATSVRVTGVFLGRLVDVYDFDAASGASALQHRDFPIGLDIASNGVDFDLRWSQAGQRDILTILHTAGSAAYANAFAQIDAQLVPMLDNGIAPSSLPPYSVVARNGALVVRFDDLLDASTLDATTLRTLVSDAGAAVPSVPFANRVIVDSNHGDLADLDNDGVPEFYSTRAIVDMTVSTAEAQTASQRLSINHTGLPPATSLHLPSVLLRIPTLPHAPSGQPQVLSNPSGHPVSFTASGSVDPASATKDVVRALRAGSSALGDPHGGALPEGIGPSLVGVQPIQLVRARDLGQGLYRVSIQFTGDTCLRVPRPGDGIELAAHVLEIVAGPPPVVSNGGTLVRNLRARLLLGNPISIVSGVPGQLTAVFSAAAGDPPECFVRFNPPAGKPPVRDVDPAASILLRFTQAMDPTTVTALDSFTVLDLSVVQSFKQRVVGTIASPDRREFSFVPSVPLDHTSSQRETFEVRLDEGLQDVRDQAGNPLAEPWPGAPFALDPTAPFQATGSLSLAFGSTDEDGNGAPEVRGQFLFDLSRGVVRARPVVRFSGIADAFTPIVSLMIPFTTGVATPLSPYGSKAELTWRYADLGFSLLDESAMNIDVEGLNWALNSAPVVDQYSEFRMALAHSKYLPDEFQNPMTLLPQWPLSGVSKTFDDNQLDPVGDPLKVVHPKTAGYTVNPIDSFVSATGTAMMPWPMNQNLPPAQFQRYTWRDTAITAVGGPNGAGVDVLNQVLVGGGKAGVYAANKVPTIGLPLLMEFRCYPDASANGLNLFKINLAINSSSRPAMRAFSTGGVLINGSQFLVDPDNTPVANGGIVNGQPTNQGLDGVFYEGQADFVVRVSRMHTIWLDTVAFTTQHVPAVVEPSAAQQPAGTQIVLAFRGAINVTSAAGTQNSKDATRYDPYGDPQGSPAPFSVTYFNNDSSWKSTTAAVNNLRFVQVRASFIANPDTSGTPEISGLGLAYLE